MAVVKCAYCNGFGRVYPDGKKENVRPCPGCGGQGSVNVGFPVTKCNWCSGNGNVYDKKKKIYEPCPACKGCGYVR